MPIPDEMKALRVAHVRSNAGYNSAYIRRIWANNNPGDPYSLYVDRLTLIEDVAVCFRRNVGPTMSDLAQAMMGG